MMTADYESQAATSSKKRSLTSAQIALIVIGSLAALLTVVVLGFKLLSPATSPAEILVVSLPEPQPATPQQLAFFREVFPEGVLKFDDSSKLTDEDRNKIKDARGQVTAKFVEISQMRPEERDAFLKKHSIDLFAVEVSKFLDAPDFGLFREFDRPTEKKSPEDEVYEGLAYHYNIMMMFVKGFDERGCVPYALFKVDRSTLGKNAFDLLQRAAGVELKLDSEGKLTLAEFSAHKQALEAAAKMIAKAATPMVMTRKPFKDVNYLLTDAHLYIEQDFKDDSSLLEFYRENRILIHRIALSAETEDFAAKDPATSVVKSVLNTYMKSISASGIFTSDPKLEMA